MLKKHTPIEQRDLLSENFALRREISELGTERDTLKDQLAGDLPRATAWLQTKVWRQRHALDRLERRNMSLRFALRIMNSLREPVSPAEWTAARDADRLRDRLDEKPPE